MINKKEFDLLLQEIVQIENKITEIKVINQFEKAREFTNTLENIRIKAKDIVLDESNNSKGFDDISLDVMSNLINLDSDVGYYFLKQNNIIESAYENQIDAEALEKIKALWTSLDKDISIWRKTNHNPIEEIEFNKHIGKTTLEIIIYQLQIEGIIDFSKVFKYCSIDFLVNAIKEALFEGANNESSDQIRRQILIDLARNCSEKDLYDYKIWQQILMTKNVESRNNHVEILMNHLHDKRKINTDNDKMSNGELGIINDGSLLNSFRIWLKNFRETGAQNKMAILWKSSKGPAFKCKFERGNTRYYRDHLDRIAVENTKILEIATNGVARYNFDSNNWKKLEEIIFLSDKNTSDISLSPDKTYNCIGNEAFINTENLKSIKFGKIQVIGQNAFKNCTKLTKIEIPEGMINIGEDAFKGCTGLTEVEFLGDLELYILNRPQNIINCFRETNLEKITFASLKSTFEFAISDCPTLKNICVSEVSGASVPFKICKYRLGRQEGIVSFVGEQSLNLWKKKNSTIRFFELTENDKEKYGIN